jgi:thiamine biosynthesis lipoprotein
VIGYETSTILCMGTIVTQLVHGAKAKKAISAANRELKRMEAQLSFHSPSSQLASLNKAAGQKPVKVGPDLLSLLRLSRALAVLTRGAFDVTVGPLVREWTVCLTSGTIPTQSRIESLLALVDAYDIEVDEGRRTAFLPKAGQSVDLGGIAKGYATDRALEVYRDYGITSGVVDLGGNVFTLGRKADGRPWRVGIQDPDAPRGTPLLVLEVIDKTVVTSGGYERYTALDGVRYHHILDPRTGWPAETDLMSSTVVGDISSVADGIATAISVVGSAGAAQVLDFKPGEPLTEKPGGSAFEALLITREKSALATTGLISHVTPLSSEGCLSVLHGAIPS